MDTIAPLIGYAATVTGASFMLPQVYKSWRTKSVDDVSWGMLTILFTNNTLWLVYGVLIGNLPVTLTNVIGLLVVAAQIGLKLRHGTPV